MGHSLKYIIPFKTLLNNSVEVHFLLRDYKGSPVELVGSGEPLTLSFDDEDFLYTPIRTSSCKISIIGNDYLQELFSIDYTQWKINIYRNKSLVWTGYIKPEIYTQDYTSDKFELNIEAVSALSVLENMEYTPLKDEANFITIWELLKSLINQSGGDWNSVYIPEVYGRDRAKVSSENVFELLELSEVNFFDEEDQAMNYLEVLEELCKILNWTVTDWNGDLFFCDIDHKGTYRKYNNSLSSYTTLTPTEANVQALTFRGGNQTLDRLGGYTKASVIVNNYATGELFPNEDISKLKSIGALDKSIQKFVTRRVHKKPEQYKAYHYSLEGTPISDEAFYKMTPEQRDNLLGATVTQVCDYKRKKEDGQWVPEITNYRYDNVIYMVEHWYELKNNRNYSKFIPQWLPLLQIETKDNILYTSGALVLNFSVCGVNQQRMMIDKIYTTYHTIWATLQIGSKWWNGQVWQTTETRFPIPIDLQDKTYVSSYANVKTNKKLGEEPEGVDGYIIPLNTELRGKATFTILAGMEASRPGGKDHGTPSGFYLKGLSLKYHATNKTERENLESGDRVYENEVNQELINELDEIKVKISTYNNDGLTHSKLLLDGKLLEDNLYCRVTDGEVRLEELLIRRIRGQYSTSKIKLTQQLKYSPILPNTLLTDRFMPGMKFSITGGEIDFFNEQMQLNMIDNNG